MPDDQTNVESPFHAGEQQVQARLGVRDIEDWARKVVRPYLPEQHRAFYAELPFLVAAARDARGRPWATLLTGGPGFADSPDPKTLRLRTRPVPGDALEGALACGTELGLLGIELASRRRNRVNGRIARDSDQGLELEVGQAFGNCPQYIREREWRLAEPGASPPAPERSRVLTLAMREQITAADTLFIATGHRGEGASASFGMDASHRGGQAGFVRVENDRQLVFPDYAGNNHFNTIGNLLRDDRAGLLFVDFEGGGMLQLTGRVEIDWDSPEVARHPGARRLLRFTLEEAVELPAALPLRWSSAGDSVRTLRLVDKRRESEDVVSFRFRARDGGPLPDFEPGQHLPVELGLPTQEEPVRRTYSLSNGPGEGEYRISVKREPLGLASRFLHDALEVGGFVDVRAPAGEFVLGSGERPVVLVSAGVGVTPLVSMLRDLVARRDARHVLFVHTARDGRHHALANEVRDLVAAAPHAEAHVQYSRPAAGDRLGRDFDAPGRLDTEGLAALLPSCDVDVYLCGPISFMAELQAGLEAQGVDPDRIHTESFGPAS
ncbi:MAG: pyridoxamine 5'-phosphate oxidase family protein [Proteobacteria bacterium]|nr:pyridoxamine 5'-phosphate oxidase family protein [Pseudomonadota bacterium]